MDNAVEKAVGRVIDAMKDTLGEQHSVDDMARRAMFSKFHFSRIFQRVTGTSPGRFLMVMRLERAKHLLLSTTLSITEITHEVGYASVGTFSSRFTSSVGVSPSMYRRQRGVTEQVPTANGGANGGTEAHEPAATVHGNVRALATGAPHTCTIFLGLFPDPVPLRRPAACAVVDHLGPYTLENAPPGTWYVLAYAAGGSAQASAGGALVGVHGPVTIDADNGAIGAVRADVALRPMNAFDPPMILALQY
jgi:AraC family transcriptional regulator